MISKIYDICSNIKIKCTVNSPLIVEVDSVTRDRGTYTKSVMCPDGISFFRCFPVIDYSFTTESIPHLLAKVWEHGRLRQRPI